MKKVSLRLVGLLMVGMLMVVGFVACAGNTEQGNNISEQNEFAQTEDKNSISEPSLEESEPSSEEEQGIDSSYVPTAISGAVILDFDGTIVNFQEKCESCGEVQSGSNKISKSNGYDSYTSSFVCSKCGETQKVEIK